MKQLSFFAALVLVAVPAMAQPPSTGIGQPITLAELEQLALQNNPTTTAATAGVEAARERTRQAGAWANPIVGYAADDLTAGGSTPRGEHGFFLEQTVPLGG